MRSVLSTIVFSAALTVATAASAIQTFPAGMPSAAPADGVSVTEVRTGDGIESARMYRAHLQAMNRVVADASEKGISERLKEHDRRLADRKEARKMHNLHVEMRERYRAERSEKSVAVRGERQVADTGVQ